MENFGWVVSYDLSPFQKFVMHVEEKTFSKWTLYARCRNEKEQTKRWYSTSKVNMLSVQTSTVEGAGMGCFTEQTYHPHQVITVYLGYRQVIDKIASHFDHPHALSVQENMTVQPGISGNDELMLGAHKCNNMNFKGGVIVKKRKGRPTENNSYLEGIYLKAKKRILIRHDIFVDSTPCQDSYGKKR